MIYFKDTTAITKQGYDPTDTTYEHICLRHGKRL